MSKADLKSRGKFSLGHRTLSAGDILATIECESKEDLDYIVSRLRWSAFEFSGVALPKPSASTIAAPKPGKKPKAVKA